MLNKIILMGRLTRDPELIRTLYAQLTESDYYKDYMQREERSFDDDKKLLEDFFKELQSCEALDDVLEEMSILWTDDLPYIVIMVLRTLSNLRVSHTELKVPAKFKSSEDPEFVKTLFGVTRDLHGEDQYLEIEVIGLVDGRHQRFFRRHHVIRARFEMGEQRLDDLYTE